MWNDIVWVFSSLFFPFLFFHPFQMMFYLVCVPALHQLSALSANFCFFLCLMFDFVELCHVLFHDFNIYLHVMLPTLKMNHPNALFNTCIIWNWKLNSCNFTPNNGHKADRMQFLPKWNLVVWVSVCLLKWMGKNENDVFSCIRSKVAQSVWWVWIVDMSSAIHWVSMVSIF